MGGGSISLKRGYFYEGASNECRNTQTENRGIWCHRSRLHILLLSLRCLSNAMSLREITSSGHNLALCYPLAIVKNRKKAPTKKICREQFKYLSRLNIASHKACRAYCNACQTVVPSDSVPRAHVDTDSVPVGTCGTDAAPVGITPVGKRTLEGFQRAAVRSSQGSKCLQRLVVEHSEHLC